MPELSKRRPTHTCIAMATLREQIATNVLTVTKFRELLRDMRENRPNDDLELVRKAYEFSQKQHSGQQRASGEPYLVHPLEVALVLAEMKMDAVAVAAGLLHDSVEDTSVTIVDIRKEFGEQVAHIVEGVTKISQIDFSTREEQQAENLRKMMLAMVDDMMGGIVRVTWRKMERYVMHDRARSGSQKGWEWFQWLYLQLERHSRGKTSLRLGAFDAFRDWKP